MNRLTRFCAYILNSCSSCMSLTAALRFRPVFAAVVTLNICGIGAELSKAAQITGQANNLMDLSLEQLLEVGCRVTEQAVP